MRIIFLGTPEFAVASLDILVRNGYDVVAVVTSVDSYGGRGGKQLLESAVKKYTVAHGIPVLQPPNLKAPAFLEKLKSYKADLQIVVAFRMLPELVWNMPPLGTINLHGSLLPKYRGAAPINHAIINGETFTGVTSFKLKHEIDTGDVIMSSSLHIDDNDDAGVLHDKLKDLGAQVILETVNKIAEGNVVFQKQSDEEATAAPKIFHETCVIDFDQSTAKVFNFIRGLSPYPAAWCKIDQKEIKILKASKIMIDDENKPGKISTDHKRFLNIKCTDGYISILDLKPEGKRVMNITDFLNGHQISDEYVG